MMAPIVSGSSEGSDMARSLTAPAVRRLVTLGALTCVLIGVLTGCTGADQAEPGPTPSPEPTTTSTPTGSSTPTPTSTAEDDDDPGEEPTAAPVAFTGSGVGSVLDGTPDALAPVEELLGPASQIEEAPFADCGAPWISTATWGPVMVTFNEGALFGWQVDGADPVPATIALPHDIHPDDPFSQVTALPGAPAPEFFDNYQVFMVSLDGVQWWADDDAPESPVTVVGHNIVGCG